MPLTEINVYIVHNAVYARWKKNVCKKKKKHQNVLQTKSLFIIL